MVGLQLCLCLVLVVTCTAEDVKSEEPSFSKPIYKPPVPSGDTFFHDAFESTDDFDNRWVISKAKKDGTHDSISKYDGKWELENSKDGGLEGDLGLVIKSKAKHHAISAKLSKPFTFSGKPLIVQYEVNFQNGIECGGAYMKLITNDNVDKVKLEEFGDRTPYTIMFGPDKCGMDYKLHFIFRHKNPVSGEIEEKHAKKPTTKIDDFYTDKKTHLYTLVIMPDNTYEVYIDKGLVNSGSLLTDVSPPVNPPKEIEDPDDKKPEDWDEKERIPDPDASKPDDWDESQPEKVVDTEAKKPDGWLDEESDLIADPDAVKPEDWDEEMDGDWEAPKIDNPKCKSAPGCGEWASPMKKNPLYKGKWKASMIDNPNYKGIWKPRKIANPEFFEDQQPYKMMSFAAVGLELWTMTDDILFDNFIIADDKEVADKWADDSWALKKRQELSKSSGKSVWDAVVDMTNERPWLWAVFIVVVVLPILLIIVYCCMPGKQKVDDFKKLKTDEAAADDEQSEPTETKESENKSDEEAEDATTETPGGGGDTETTTRRRKTKKSDLEQEQNTEEDEEEESDEKNKSSPRKSPRKRKTRKD